MVHGDGIVFVVHLVLHTHILFMSLLYITAISSVMVGTAVKNLASRLMRNRVGLYVEHGG